MTGSRSCPQDKLKLKSKKSPMKCGKGVGKQPKISAGKPRSASVASAEESKVKENQETNAAKQLQPSQSSSKSVSAKTNFGSSIPNKAETQSTEAMTGSALKSSKPQQTTSAACTTNSVASSMSSPTQKCSGMYQIKDMLVIRPAERVVGNSEKVSSVTTNGFDQARAVVMPSANDDKQVTASASSSAVACKSSSCDSVSTEGCGDASRLSTKMPVTTAEGKVSSSLLADNKQVEVVKPLQQANEVQVSKAAVASASEQVLVRQCDVTAMLAHAHAAHSDSVVSDVCRPRFIVARDSLSEQHLHDVDVCDASAPDGDLTHLLFARHWIEPEGDTVQSGSGFFEGFRLPMMSDDDVATAGASGSVSYASEESDRSCTDGEPIFKKIQ